MEEAKKDEEMLVEHAGYLCVKREVERAKDRQPRRAWLRKPVVRYGIAIGLTCCVVMTVTWAFSGNEKVTAQPVGGNISPDDHLSANIYERKNVTLDDIESLSNVHHRHQSSDHQVDTHQSSGDDHEAGEASPSLASESAINVFSDPRYTLAASSSKTSSSGRTSFRIPPGTSFHAIIERQISTRQRSVPVMVSVYFSETGEQPQYLPERSKLLGKISDIEGDRVFIRFDEGTLPDGTMFDISAIAMEESYGQATSAGIVGMVDRDVGRRGGSIMASSMMRATRSLSALNGSSFGAVLAGEAADQTLNEMDNDVNDSLKTYDGPEVTIPANTRFLVVVE